MSLLRVEHVDVHYGEFQALFDVSLTVRAGETVALIGSNGAGKSTLLKCICGWVHPSSGRVLFEGEPIEHASPQEIVRKGIALCPEGRRVFPRLTVMENLQMGGYTAEPGAFQERLGEVFELFPRLKERRQQAAGSLSGGEQQMLAIGRALMAGPKLLLLDEPSLGLAPIIVDAVFDVIERITKRGVTVLLVEQNAHMALGAADRAYVLEGGRIVKEDTGRALLEDEEVKTAYLGI